MLSKSTSSIVLKHAGTALRAPIFSLSRNIRASSLRAVTPLSSPYYTRSAGRFFSSESDILKKPPTAAPTPKPPPTPLTETVRDFLDPADVTSFLAEQGLNFYTGVPDSLLQDFCAYVDDNLPPEQHIITANEGAAIAVASGYHFATGKIGVVYMQNSGFGNAVNPLLSLADPQVYSIPMLLFVGWRGEPGKKDEPQHIVQGKRMAGMLSSMSINYEVLPDYIEGAKEAIEGAVQQMKKRSTPYVFLVKRQTFLPYRKKENADSGENLLLREQVLNILLDEAGKWDSFVCTTGFTSREMYEMRAQRKDNHERDFLTVGSMGHASAIALGIALGKPSRQVVCLDGDGALLMHMGTLATIGTRKPKNFKHIILNNNAHESVGGQLTGAFSVDVPSLAKSCGYTFVASASSEQQVRDGLRKLLKEESGPALLEIKIRTGARANLGRPKHTPAQSKDIFMQFLRS